MKCWFWLALSFVLTCHARASNGKDNFHYTKDLFYPVLRQPSTAPKIKTEEKLLTPYEDCFIKLYNSSAKKIAELLQGKNGWLTEAGKILIDEHHNTLWLRDHKSNIDNLKKMIKSLDAPMQQIMIEAKIVNMSEHVVNDLGLSFNIASDEKGGRITGDKTSVTNYNSQKKGFSWHFDTNPLLRAVPKTLAIINYQDSFALNMELAALESEGKAKIIASPKLMTTNRTPAVIESGEEIPYQKATLSGATAVSFKKAVLGLHVTPHIINNNLLSMKLKINQDIRGSEAANGIPSVLTKAIHSEVLVKSGQTIVLGGIFKKEKLDQLERIPFLGDLPIIGQLFQHHIHNVRNEELLIFITPRIIYNQNLQQSNKWGNFTKLKALNKLVSR